MFVWSNGLVLSALALPVSQLKFNLDGSLSFHSFSFSFTCVSRLSNFNVRK